MQESKLSPEQLEQAEALLNLGFFRAGNSEEYLAKSDVFIECWHGWKFYSDFHGESYLDAVCNGVLYSYSLILDGDDLDFNQRLSEAKAAIHNVVLRQQDKQDKEPKQLTLFEV